ncbi:MAG TPA: transcriptional repressor [Sedimentisphaerales bacterium]|nr:transcriptional repressor [Phycisphaerae bacterium]HON90488.1 transcriptional repressor [Sedimentisphaerales bacterium]HQG48977.1 transcriptional repressor [Sedimentisphaerales bacterium]
MSKQSEDTARHMLQEAKLYCTEARVTILRVLLEAGGPLRQDQIARGESHKLNKVTVYRTLESLTEAGLVHRAFMQNRAWHFELANHCSEKQCHPHFTCTNCGVTQCMTDISFPMAQIPQKGYVISRQQVRLEGLCPACA